MSLEASSLKEGGNVTMLLLDYYCCVDIASDVDDVMRSLPCCAKR